MSSKGQITIPQEVRQQLGFKAGDKVAIQVDSGQVTISLTRSQLDAIYQSVPPLTIPHKWEEMTELAAEEHARDAVKEGLD